MVRDCFKNIIVIKILYYFLFDLSLNYLVHKDLIIDGKNFRHSSTSVTDFYSKQLNVQLILTYLHIFEGVWFVTCSWSHSKRNPLF